MKKLIMGAALAAVLASPLAATFAAAPNWDTTGSYQVAFNYLGTDYGHDMNLTQASGGGLTGNGGSPIGANTYTWVITSGSVSGDTIDFYANYTATADAVTPQTTMHVTGTIASDGTMSGTWSDNYQNGSRAGTWRTTVGTADEIVTPPPTTDVKDQCKNGGWKNFTNPSYKNQGQCVSAVERASH